MPPDDQQPPSPEVVRPQPGIPDEPEGSAPAGRAAAEFDAGAPVGPTPQMDFWRAVYERRSIRKFKSDPVPRELVDQLMHAGIWAPSSCNYQMWDLVAVDDAATNRKLAELSLQMGNAPVNVIVSYGRDFSEEGWANVQSASALIQNMSLAAHVLGLGTFWITQMGDREKVREIVGLPYDRLVIAVVAVGWPKFAPKQGPKRRPLGQVTHWNHYGGRPIPSSTRPADWEPDLLSIYQRARVLNGLRHNKPRAWEVRAIDALLERWVGDGREEGARDKRWLDVLPCTGIVSERIARARPGYRYDVAERTPEVAEFVAARVRGQIRAWPHADARAGFAAPEDGAYDVVSCLYRLEDVAPAERAELARALARWVKPGGRVIVGFVSRASFHDWTEKLRARRGGLKGVEYVLSPDPNIGPFESLAPSEIERALSDAGLRVVARFGQQAVPQPEEIEFRARNFGPRKKSIARFAGRVLAALERLPGVQNARGRFRYLLLERAS
ncbi:MAG: methyltransferase domain-containing protein [Planctomycetota bacterium]|nr:MAG: methyltransferase domain-containing protein [Planctomycetota bacterium]